MLLSTQCGARRAASSRRVAPTPRKNGAMTTVRYNPDPAAPAELSPEQEAFQQALSSEEIEWLAASDPDNPPSSDEELDRGVAAREVRLVREKTGLSQHRFA